MQGRPKEPTVARRTAPMVDLLFIFALHLVIPVALLAAVCGIPLSNRAVWAGCTLLFGAYLAHVWVLGRWDVIGYGIRGMLPLAFLVGAAVSFARTRRRTWRPEGHAASLAVSGSVALGLVFATTAGLGLTGHRAPPNAVDLLFPLPDGVAYVGQGGSTSVINYHRAHPAEAYALDLFMLNERGGRASGLQPAANEEYASWGARVVSPCTGVVAGARDHVPDHTPGQRNLDVPTGNYVAIYCDGVTVFLAHMKEGSVAVRLGTLVRAGETIGRVGNSGNSSEPHLHIHAEKGAPRAITPLRTGVPITFGGRYLVRNSLVF